MWTMLKLPTVLRWPGWSYSVNLTVRKLFKEQCSSCASYSKMSSRSTLETWKRHFSTEILEDVVPEKNVEKKKSKKKKKGNFGETLGKLTKTEEIFRYLSSKQYLEPYLETMPSRFLKRTRIVPEGLYLLDKQIADTIADAVKDHILAGDGLVMEGNPGLGFLTEALLSRGVPKIRGFQSYASVISRFEGLCTKYPKQLELMKQDIFAIPKLTFQDKIDNGKRFEELMHGVKIRNWTDDPPVKIIGAMSRKAFIHYVIRTVMFQNDLMSYGRPEFYLLMHPSNYIHYTASRDSGYLLYRSTSVLFQLIFDHSLLAKVPRNAFFPWETGYTEKKGMKLPQLKIENSEYLYLVKIVPHKDLFEKVARTEDLQPLWFFIRHHLVSRKNQVIPQLERWIPGCGLRLIPQGFTIFTEFGELTPLEILDLFHQFKSWPEYPDCPFLPAMETSMLKMEQVPDEVDKEIEESKRSVTRTSEDLDSAEKD